MRPAEVLDHQASLLDYLQSQHYAGYLERFIGDMAKKGKVVESKVSGFERSLAASLRVAQAFHVQAEMMPLLRAAAHDLDGLDYLVHERLPAEHGFLMFDDSWLTTEAWGRTVTIKALQWWHGSAAMRDDGGNAGTLAGIWVAQYTDLNDEQDEVNRDLVEKYGTDVLRTLGRLHIGDLRFLPYGQRVGPVDTLTDEEYAQYAWEGQTLTKKVPNDTRMIVGLFRLLSQVLVEVKDSPLDRSAQRRAKRAKIPARVQTVKLRRKETHYLHPSEGGSAVDWQHSWWVRGHWAWRKCGAEHPLAEEYEKGFRARVYIAPYPKGPEDKPVLITEKVWDLAR